MKKPKIGEPCNGCGICCMNQTCQNGSYVLRLVKNIGDYHKGRCPALVDNKNGTFSCGIILNPKRYIKRNYPEHILKKYFKILIGSENGCDELLENDTKQEEENLYNIILNLKNNPEWLELVKKAVRIIHGI